MTLGEQGGGSWEVLSGFSDGEEIAMGASFLVDSESRLASALAGMKASDPAPTPRAATPAPHVH